MKKILLTLLTGLVLTSGLCAKNFNSNSAIETVKNMGAGWNLGNTFDATGASDLTAETSWQMPKTTKAMIDGLKKSGIKTIRIPVSWSKHMDQNYKVDEAWMNRVKEVVDWAICDGMYVIINSHHDCWEKPEKMPAVSGYYPNQVNYEESSRYLTKLWTQIGTVLNNDYDEHLIFETMNEPRLKGTSFEWWFNKDSKDCREAAQVLNKLNQDALNAIRATGGNNKKRFVACPSYVASPDAAFSDAFVMPTDIEPGHLILSVHSYSPYKFAMESPGATVFSSAYASENAALFKKLNDRFISKGYAVYIGEYGATNKNNLNDRVMWFRSYIAGTKKYGICCILWDNGVWKVTGNDYSEHFGYYDRINQSWFFPEILNTIVTEANK